MNLLSCEREPIHIPGRIQSHGFLIAFAEGTGEIHYLSDNLEQHTGICPKGIAGSNFWSLLERISLTGTDVFRKQLEHAVADNFTNRNYAELEQQGRGVYNLVFSRAGDMLIADFEKMPAAIVHAADSQDAYAQILTYNTIEQASQFLCTEIRRHSGFGRVMVYRFDDDYNGEVIAEAGDAFGHSLLHHHFPASDIPAQARQLYLLNRMRLISDVDDAGAALIAGPDEARPLDLTWSILRSVSPIHIRYLKNMGVGASYSISIVHKERLWGLVTCHNKSPLHIPLRTRNHCKTITDIFAANLTNLYALTTNREADKFAAALADATTQIILTGQTASLLGKKLNDAAGAAYLNGDELLVKGRVPAEDTIRQIADLIIKENKEVFSTDSLRSRLPEIRHEDEQLASGVLGLLLSEKGREVLMWFKPEVESTIKWAGNPEQIYATYDHIEALNPRNSFETWSQRFSGRSEGWNSGELKIAKSLSGEILKINQERSDVIRDLHEKLQQAYDELSTFSYTVSHDLKTPLTAVKNYAQLLIMKESLSARGEAFTTRIISSANKMHSFIDDLFSYTRVGFSEPVKETVVVREVVDAILQDYRAVYGKKFTVEIGALPDVESDKTLIYQIFSNLIGNAIKYSMAKDIPLVRISGEVSGGHFRFSVSDNGIGMPSGEIKHLFTRFYRLSNARRFEGTGLGLAITKRIVEKLRGTIEIHSKENEGTECVITLPHG